MTPFLWSGVALAAVALLYLFIRWLRRPSPSPRDYTRTPITHNTPRILSREDFAKLKGEQAAQRQAEAAKSKLRTSTSSQNSYTAPQPVSRLEDAADDFTVVDMLVVNSVFSDDSTSHSSDDSSSFDFGGGDSGGGGADSSWSSSD